MEREFSGYVRKQLKKEWLINSQTSDIYSYFSDAHVFFPYLFGYKSPLSSESKYSTIFFTSQFWVVLFRLLLLSSSSPYASSFFPFYFPCNFPSAPQLNPESFKNFREPALFFMPITSFSLVFFIRSFKLAFCTLSRFVLFPYDTIGVQFIFFVLEVYLWVASLPVWKKLLIEKLFRVEEGSFSIFFTLIFVAYSTFYIAAQLLQQIFKLLLSLRPQCLAAILL